MTDLVRFLEQGNYLALVILALMLTILWVVKQWRTAEAAKDALHQARLADAKEMVTLSAEIKSTMEALVAIVRERR